MTTDYDVMRFNFESDVEFQKIKKGYKLIDNESVFENIIKIIKKLPKISVGDLININDEGIGIVVSVEMAMHKSQPRLGETLVGVWFGNRNHKKWKIKYFPFSILKNNFKIIDDEEPV